ncbi:MAG: hypothetical protein ABJF67_17675 [Aurantimonas coralicida]
MSTALAIGVVEIRTGATTTEVSSEVVQGHPLTWRYSQIVAGRIELIWEYANLDICEQHIAMAAAEIRARPDFRPGTAVLACRLVEAGRSA